MGMPPEKILDLIETMTKEQERILNDDVQADPGMSLVKWGIEYGKKVALEKLYIKIIRG